MARPTKLTQKLLDKFQAILDDDLNALVCTDEELLILLNDELEENERISEDSFQRYKAGKLKEDTSLLKQFCGLYKRALIKQRLNLMKELKTTDSSWQRFAWIIERKFDEWNMKIKNETKLDGNLTAKVIPLPPLREEDDAGDSTKTKSVTSD